LTEGIEAPEKKRFSEVMGVEEMCKRFVMAESCAASQIAATEGVVVAEM